jgi:hypothetical protein
MIGVEVVTTTLGAVETPCGGTGCWLSASEVGSAPSMVSVENSENTHKVSFLFKIPKQKANVFSQTLTYPSYSRKRVPTETKVGVIQLIPNQTMKLPSDSL